ncbi:hypothetical protein BGX28_010211, partial [Mortierella sp. GBA30]
TPITTEPIGSARGGNSGKAIAQEHRPEWSIALDEHAVNVREEMIAMESRLVQTIHSALGTYNTRVPLTNVSHDPSAMRDPKPVIEDESSDNETDDLDPLGSPLTNNHAARNDTRPNPSTSRRNTEEDESVESYRRILERIKSYQGPTFSLSRKQGKYADDWIRAFDNWFRARVCDPNIDDSTIRAGVMRLVMSAVEKHVAASEWCRSRIRTRGITYQTLMEDLSDTFMDLREARRRTQIGFLQEAPQTANERIAAYNVRFKTRADLHQAACARARRLPDPRSLLSSYAAGLYDPSQRFIALRQKNWEAAMEYMRKLGAKYNEIELARQPGDDTEESTDDEVSEEEGTKTADDKVHRQKATRVKMGVSKNKESDRQWESVQKDLKLVTKQIGDLTILVGKQQKGSTPRTPGAPMTSTPRKDLSKVQCYNCDEFGHFSNKCPKPTKMRTLMAQKWIQAEEYQDTEQAREFSCYLTKADADEYLEELVAREEQGF